MGAWVYIGFPYFTEIKYYSFFCEQHSNYKEISVDNSTNQLHTMATGASLDNNVKFLGKKYIIVN